MESQKPAPQSDEIDLGQLMARVGDFFLNMWLGFVRILALLRRVPLENRWSFLGIITASVAIGLVYSNFIKKSFYESTMILSSQYFNKRLVDSMVDKLNLLADEPSKEGLARTLNLPRETAHNIARFDAKPFVSETDLVETEVLKEQLRNLQSANRNEQLISEVIERIEVENRRSFEITVRVYSPGIIGNLQIALVDYFRGNPFVRKRIEISHENLVQKKDKLKGDLNKLDSLKAVIYQNYKSMSQQKQGSNNVILSDKAVTDPIEIFNQDREVYAQYQLVNRDLYIRPDFEMVDGFTEFSEPASLSLTILLFYSVLIGIVVAYLDVALRSLNNYLATVK